MDAVEGNSSTPLLSPGFVIRERWEVVKKIGGGGFGEIYKARDHETNMPCAIKVESSSSNKQVLRMEVAVLKRLQKSLSNICEFLGCGRASKVNYLVMTLLGPNLSELRKHQPSQRFSVSTTMRTGIQIIMAVQCMHNSGFLHRDIKPSNFAIGATPETCRNCYMLDFGLARQYTTVTGEVRQPRPIAGFRGTVRYASLNAHLSRDLGRQDDLWSVFYMLVELSVGQLPWRKIRDKEEAGDFKAKFDHKKLIKTLPKEFDIFLKHLKALSYFDKPDYSMLIQVLRDAMNRLRIQDSDIFDWEQDYSAPSMTTASNVSPPAMKIVHEEKDANNQQSPLKEPSKTNCSEVEGLSDSGQQQKHSVSGKGKGKAMAVHLTVPMKRFLPVMNNNNNRPPQQQKKKGGGDTKHYVLNTKENSEGKSGSAPRLEKVVDLGGEGPKSGSELERDLKAINCYLSKEEEAEEEDDNDAGHKGQQSGKKSTEHSSNDRDRISSGGQLPHIKISHSPSSLNKVADGPESPAKSNQIESLNRFFDLEPYLGSKSQESQEQGHTSNSKGLFPATSSNSGPLGLPNIFNDAAIYPDGIKEGKSAFADMALVSLSSEKDTTHTHSGSPATKDKLKVKEEYVTCSVSDSADDRPLIEYDEASAYQTDIFTLPSIGPRQYLTANDGAASSASKSAPVKPKIKQSVHSDATIGRDRPSVVGKDKPSTETNAGRDKPLTVNRERPSTDKPSTTETNAGRDKHLTVNRDRTSTDKPSTDANAGGDKPLTVNTDKPSTFGKVTSTDTKRDKPSAVGKDKPSADIKPSTDKSSTVEKTKPASTDTNRDKPSTDKPSLDTNAGRDKPLTVNRDKPSTDKPSNAGRDKPLTVDRDTPSNDKPSTDANVGREAVTRDKPSTFGKDKPSVDTNDKPLTDVRDKLSTVEKKKPPSTNTERDKPPIVENNEPSTDASAGRVRQSKNKPTDTNAVRDKHPISSQFKKTAAVAAAEHQKDTGVRNVPNQDAVGTKIAGLDINSTKKSTEDTGTKQSTDSRTKHSDAENTKAKDLKAAAEHSPEKSSPTKHCENPGENKNLETHSPDAVTKHSKALTDIQEGGSKAPEVRTKHPKTSSAKITRDAATTVGNLTNAETSKHFTPIPADSPNTTQQHSTDLKPKHSVDARAKHSATNTSGDVVMGHTNTSKQVRIEEVGKSVEKQSSDSIMHSSSTKDSTSGDAEVGQVSAKISKHISIKRLSSTIEERHNPDPVAIPPAVTQHSTNTLRDIATAESSKITSEHLGTKETAQEHYLTKKHLSEMITRTASDPLAAAGTVKSSAGPSGTILPGNPGHSKGVTQSGHTAGIPRHSSASLSCMIELQSKTHKSMDPTETETESSAAGSEPCKQCPRPPKNPPPQNYQLSLSARRRRFLRAVNKQ